MKKPNVNVIVAGTILVQTAVGTLACSSTTPGQQKVVQTGALPPAPAVASSAPASESTTPSKVPIDIPLPAQAPASTMPASEDTGQAPVLTSAPVK